MDSHTILKVSIQEMSLNIKLNEKREELTKE